MGMNGRRAKGTRSASASAARSNASPGGHGRAAKGAAAAVPTRMRFASNKKPLCLQYNGIITNATKRLLAQKAKKCPKVPFLKWLASYFDVFFAFLFTLHIRLLNFLLEPADKLFPPPSQSQRPLLSRSLTSRQLPALTHKPLFRRPITPMTSSAIGKRNPHDVRKTVSLDSSSTREWRRSWPTDMRTTQASQEVQEEAARTREPAGRTHSWD